jgi:hypothetical protein
MRRTVTSLALAAIAVLVVTASVAAADPFGWGRNATSSNRSIAGQAWGSTGWSQAGAVTSQGTAVNPLGATRPVATARPAVAPVNVQTHQAATVRASRSSTTTHHATGTWQYDQGNTRGCGCCGGSDDHGSSWGH